MTWWQEGNRLRDVPKGLALAAAYAVICWATRQISLDQFYLPAGVRVAALLLFPRRLWIYLLLGEYAYFAHMRIPMIDRHGLLWVILGSVTLMPVVAFIVHKHLRKIESENEAWTLSAVALSALAVTALNVLLAHFLMPVAPPAPITTEIVRFAVGDYVGMLTVVPIVMLWKRRSEVSTDIVRYARSSTLAIALMLALGVASLLLPDVYEILASNLQVLMALPAIALTCMHGWKGAAIAIPILNLLMGVTSPPWTYDPHVFATQQILAVAGTAMLCMGSAISHYYHEHMAGSRRERLAAAHARASHVSGEMELRKRVLCMKEVGDGIDHSLSEIAHGLREKRHHALADALMKVAVVNSRSFREQTSMVYPTALEHVGLYLALQVSGIANEWKRTERVLAPRLTGDPCRLTVGLQLAAYRALTEATSILLNAERGHILVRARCGRVAGRQGIIVLVGMSLRDQLLNDATVARLMARLTGRTLAYRGSVRCRRGSVRIVLMENATTRTSIEYDLNADPSASERRRVPGS